MAREKLLISLAVFLAIAIIYCWPIYKDFGYWGQRDWDEAFFWNGLARKSILDYRQFPVWNPYSRGGMVFLAYPHSPFLSPMFLSVLLFGVVAGLKMEVIAYLFLGLSGMYILSRSLELSRASSYLSAFVYNLSSIYVLHLTEGHIGWLAMELMPWLFLAYIRSAKDRLWLITGGAIFSLFIAAGSVDATSIVVIYFVPLSLFTSLKEKRLFPVISIISMFLIGSLLIMVKLLPMLNFLAAYPRLTDAADGVTFKTTADMLLNRRQFFLDTLSLDGIGLKEYWHEYGAYVGIVPVVLSLAGLFSHIRRFWPLAITGLISLLIVMGDESFINLWRLLHILPFYEMLTVPSRYMLGVVFGIAIFSGLGLESLREKIRIPKRSILRKALSWGIVLFVLGDLFMVNSPVFKNAFIISPKKVPGTGKFVQTRSTLAMTETTISDIYYSFLSNKGTVDSYETMPVNSHASPQDGTDYKGEVYLDSGYGKAYLQYFSPNRIVVGVEASKRDLVVLNQNYYRGWKVIKKGRMLCADNHNGLISTTVEPDIDRVIFLYRPFDLVIGQFISIITICICIFIWVRSSKA